MPAVAPTPASAVTCHDFADGLRLDLDLGVAQYPVFLTEKPAAILAKYCESLIGKPTHERQSLRLNQPPRAIVLCDENTAELFGVDIESQLITAGWQVDALTVTAGEAAKTLTAAEQICEALASLGATRDTVLISLGGGVISDLAGFVAGIYKRGMHLAHISTTLVGLVDAAIGGKTAVNLPSAKNQIGLYKHPLTIVSDPAYLATLPEEEYTCGLAEAAKTAILAGDDFMTWLEESSAALKNREPGALRELIARCISFKAEVVATDPVEDNNPSERFSLNYGHTMGHVIETITAARAQTALTEYAAANPRPDDSPDPTPDTALILAQAGVSAPIPHGIAVAQGMRFEARMAMQLADASADFVLRQDALLDALGIPALDPAIMGTDLDMMGEVFARDKKNLDSDLRFILLSAPAQPELVTVPQNILFDHLRTWLGLNVTPPQQPQSQPQPSQQPPQEQQQEDQA